jgi:hypothetical protein
LRDRRSIWCLAREYVSELANHMEAAISTVAGNVQCRHADLDPDLELDVKAVVRCVQVKSSKRHSALQHHFRWMRLPILEDRVSV